MRMFVHRPILNFTPRGKLWPPGVKLSPRGEVVPQGWISPLGVKLSSGGEVKSLLISNLDKVIYYDSDLTSP
jgi:hypothetical protein